MSDKMMTLEDLLHHQLQDLYSAESQLLEALPKMLEKVSDSKLKEAIKGHLEETKEQQKRVEEACRKLSIKPNGEKCKAMEGLLKEADHFLKSKADADVMDAGIIANAQRVEHYEIAGYGTAQQYAQQLGMTEVAEILEQTLEEEKEANDKLNSIAIERVNKYAEN